MVLALIATLALPGFLYPLFAQNASSSKASPASSAGRSLGEPVLNIALMTDVKSVTIDCASGLALRRDDGDEIRSREAPPLRLKFEVQQRPGMTASRQSSYRVFVGSFDNERQAKRLTAELRDKYGEPAVTAFDDDSRNYEVAVEGFESINDAEDLAQKLRKTGYRSARVEQMDDPGPRVSQSTGPRERDSSAARAKKAAAPTEAPSAAISQVVALDQGRVVAASGQRLLVAPAEFQKADSFQKSDNRAINRPASDQVRAPKAGGSAAADPTAARSDDKKSGSKSQYDFSRGTSSKEPAPREDSMSRRSTTADLAQVNFIRVDGKRYRGEIRIVLNKRNTINVINTVAIEDYLRGVVPMELSPLGFPQIEALKAQAVAARSYALAHRGDREIEGYDLRDDARSQVYGGVDAEHEFSDRAVRETRGIVATAPGVDGKPAPIDAMYSANCGGHTENNEDVFGGETRSYLRGVACEVDRAALIGRELNTGRLPAPLTDSAGRSVTREAALLQVLGFALPQQINSRYLAAPADASDLRSWSDRASRTVGQTAPPFNGSNTLAAFAELAASSVYGEGRASVLMPPADASYVLSGFEPPQTNDDSARHPQERTAGQAARGTPRERSSLALLIKTGAFRPPFDAPFDLTAPVSRALAIETLGRALLNRSREAGNTGNGSKSQLSNLGSQIPSLRAEAVSGVENGRLIAGSSSSAKPGSAGSTQPGARGYVTVEASSARVNRSNQDSDQPGGRSAADPNGQNAGGTKANTAQSTSMASQQLGLEVARDAWLFRNLAGELYQVKRLMLIGGEQVIYHVGPDGRIDFLEASTSDRTAAADRFGRIASWQQRLSADDLSARLTRAKAGVGQPLSIDPITVAESGRVTELEFTGTSGKSRLRRGQIKNVLGLRENLFVVDPETDEKGRVIAFVFSGRGWGHGVGLCQTGAFGLAREGYSYEAILRKYYTGIQLQKSF
jgi:peptidoglycan hydrolase-like amidase